jgi:hypothetical protein
MISEGEASRVENSRSNCSLPVDSRLSFRRATSVRFGEAPSLRRSYPASSVLRTSPPPHTARPVSRELPVDPYRDHRWGFPCCLWPPMRRRVSAASIRFIGFSLGMYSVLAVLLGLLGDEAFLTCWY